MLDQLLRNDALDGSGLPVGENTAIHSSYEGLGRRSITLAMSSASYSFNLSSAPTVDTKMNRHRYR